MTSFEQEIQSLAKQAETTGQKSFKIMEIGQVDDCYLFPRSPWPVLFFVVILYLLHEWSPPPDNYFLLDTFIVGLCYSLVLFMIGVGGEFTTLSYLKGDAKKARDVCRKFGFRPYLCAYGYYGDCFMLCASLDGKRHSPKHYSDGLILRDHILPD